MGARTDFVRALVMGVVIGAALTTAFFQLRGGTAASTAPSTPAIGSAAIPHDAVARSREIQQLKTRIAELERAEGTPIQVDENVGMSTDDRWWQKLPANPAWDEPRQQTIIDRLAKYVGVTLDPKQVECKTRCCRIALPDDTYEERLDDITSSVGIGFEPPDGIGTAKAGNAYLITACWSTRPLAGPLPDRAVEREALLAKAQAAIATCAHDVSPVITLELQLHLDEDGQIEKVDSNAKQLGQKAASCAETALLGAASFAPAPMSTRVPIRVPLGK